MKKEQYRQAFYMTLPVMTGYLFLGCAFGILFQEQGYGALWAALMSLTVYAGSLQFAAVSLFAAPFSPLSALLLALTVNVRHVFYGLSMLDKYEGNTLTKWYCVFGLSDETYSLLCTGETPKDADPARFRFFVTLFDQCYWILGSIAGALIGRYLPFSSEGIDFVMTALFLVIVIEQWEKTEDHRPAIGGFILSLICLLVFGADSFLIPSMTAILIFQYLLYRRDGRRNEASDSQTPLGCAKTESGAQTRKKGGAGTC